MSGFHLTVQENDLLLTDFVRSTPNISVGLNIRETD